MSTYSYQNLNPTQFEQLVILICQNLFGMGVQGFSEGRDGGRDAKFHGTAESFPSTSSPWQGVTIIQAKHAAGYNTSFSESTFFKQGNKSCLIAKELPRVKNLFDSKKLDNYILFSNRKLTGGAEDNICQHIHENVGISLEKIKLIGIDNIETYLIQYPDIPSKINLRIGDMPININPNDLAELIEHMAKILPIITQDLEDAPVKRTSYERKNVLNNMSPSFATLLRKNFLKETENIDRYLSHSANYYFKEIYLNIVDDFQRKIIAKRDQFDRFDDVYNYLVQLILDRSPFIRQAENQKLMKAMLFYMYWNCDLGESDADTN